jgi:hypothetical protein
VQGWLHVGGACVVHALRPKGLATVRRCCAELLEVLRVCSTLGRQSRGSVSRCSAGEGNLGDGRGRQALFVHSVYVVKCDHLSSTFCSPEGLCLRRFRPQDGLCQQAPLQPCHRRLLQGPPGAASRQPCVECSCGVERCVEHDGCQTRRVDPSTTRKGLDVPL